MLIKINGKYLSWLRYTKIVAIKEEKPSFSWSSPQVFFCEKLWYFNLMTKATSIR